MPSSDVREGRSDDGREVSAPRDRRPHGGTSVPVRSGDEAEPGSALWWAERASTESRRRPRPGGLSTERIVDAALDVLREDGVEALTVREVAARLDTRSASLYRYIASRDELIALIADHVMGEIRIVSTGHGWRADVEALMQEMRRVMVSQPLPSSAGRNFGGYGPNTLRVIDSALRLLLDTGLEASYAAYAASSMIQFVAGAASIQRSDVGRGAHGASRSDGFTLLLEGLDLEHFGAFRVAGHEYLAATADDVFSHGIEIFLDGIACRIPQ